MALLQLSSKPENDSKVHCVPISIKKKTKAIQEKMIHLITLFIKIHLKAAISRNARHRLGGDISKHKK